MIKRILPLAVLAALMISGCEKSPSDTAADVADARKDAAEDIGEARSDAGKTVINAQKQVSDARKDYGETDQRALKTLTEAESNAMIKTANAQFDVAKAEAEGRYEIEMKKCNGLEGATRDACLNAAATDRANDLAKATEARDQALLSAEKHK